MGSECTTYSFADLLSNVVDNRGKTCPVDEAGLPLIATNCVKNETLYPVFEKVRHVSQHTYDTWFRGHPEPGDMIFVCKGSPGNVCWTPDPVNFCIAQDMVAIRANDEVVDPKFLFALLRSPKAQQRILNMHVGTLIPHFKKGDFKNLYFDIPNDRGVQKATGNIYFMLSNKIELNQRMNEMLEAMAQALFKSWFVDFDPVIDNALAAGHAIPEPLQKRAEARQTLGKKRKRLPLSIAQHFPDRFVFNEQIGWIPEGWEARQVTDFGSVICGKTPSKGNASYYGDAVPFIKIPDMHHSVWITDTSDGLSLNGARSQAKKQIPANSICVSCIATVGKVVITSRDSHTNQQINSVVPCREEFKYFLYFAFTVMTKILHDLASGGSATLNLNTGNFSRIYLLSPPIGIMDTYHRSVDSLFQKMLTNDLASRCLTNLRDTLLPKLLSGELRIPDVEKLMEEAL